MNLRTRRSTYRGAAPRSLLAPFFVAAFGALCLSACVSVAKMHDGTKPIATIKADRKEIGIRKVDSKSTNVLAGRGCSDYPEAVEIVPGKHELDICFVVTSGAMWTRVVTVDAAEGGSYTIKARIAGYQMSLWIEDDQSGSRVAGGL